LLVLLLPPPTCRPGRDKLSIVLTSGKGKDMIVDATPGKGSGTPLNAVQVRDKWLRLLVQARNELQFRLQAMPRQAIGSSEGAVNTSTREKPQERAAVIKSPPQQAEAPRARQSAAPLEFRPKPAAKSTETLAAKQSKSFEEKYTQTDSSREREQQLATSTKMCNFVLLTILVFVFSSAVVFSHQAYQYLVVVGAPPQGFNPFSNTGTQLAHKNEGVPSAFLGVVQSSNSAIPGYYLIV